MSTKNYYGLKTKDIGQFLGEIFEYRKELVKRNKEKEDFKYEVMDSYVQEYMEEGKTKAEAVHYFKNQFEINRIVPKIMYENAEDLMFRLYDNNLIIPVFIRESIYQDLLNFKSIEEYGYWDNVDKPDNISDKEWEKRGYTWAETFDGKRYMEIEVFQETISSMEYYKRYKSG